MVNKKNILVIGRKGIAETVENEFGLEGDDWQIINIIKFFDVSPLSEAKIAHDMSKACCGTKDKLTQILFVFGRKLDEREIKIYNIVKKRIFGDDDIANYTTIVRIISNGSFPENEKESLSDKIGSKKIIYLNFPSLVGAKPEEEEKYKEIRGKSRNELLEHLKVCEGESYGPNCCLKLINKIFEDYLEKEELDEKLRIRREKKKNPLNAFKKKELKKDLEEAEKGLREAETSGKEKELKKAKEKLEKAKEEIENSSLKAVIEIKDINEGL